jgi:hypothetical protein
LNSEDEKKFIENKNKVFFERGYQIYKNNPEIQQKFHEYLEKKVLMRAVSASMKIEYPEDAESIDKTVEKVFDLRDISFDEIEVMLKNVQK